MKKRRILPWTAFVTMVWLILLLTACAPAAPTPTLTPPASPVSGGTAEPSPASQENSDAAADISTAAAAGDVVADSEVATVSSGDGDDSDSS